VGGGGGRAGLRGAALGQAEGEARIAELERKVEALSREVEQKRFDVLPQVPEKGVYGLGPAASKVYGVEQGVSLGGYGEALYQNFEDDAKTDEWDFLRAVLYAGYKYNGRLVLNTEIEFEHAADDKEGEVSVEFALPGLPVRALAQCAGRPRAGAHGAPERAA